MSNPEVTIMLAVAIVVLGLIGIGMVVRRLRQLPKRTQGKWTRIFTWKYVYANDAAGFVRFKFVWFRIYNDWKDGTTTTIYRESMD